MRVFNTLEEILHEAAAGDDIRRYLQARSIVTIGTFALVAKDEEELQRNIIGPLMAGWGSGASSITLNETEKPIAKAVLLHVWNLARTSWMRNMQSATPTVAPPAAGTTSSPSSTPTDSKIPKALPAGKWTELVEFYNKITVNGRPRQFPTKELLGAETVIARLHYERHHSHLYTPLQLGEILQVRSFTASGEINPLVAKHGRKSLPLTLNEDKEIIESEEPTWVPRSVLSVLDGIQARRWALILVQMDEEHEIHSFCDWMQQRARSKPDKMEQMVSFWHSSMWKIAMAMRAGETFGTAAQRVQQDLEAFHEAMTKEPNFKPKIKSPIKTELTIKGDPRLSKGGKQGKGSSSDRYQPYARPKYGDQHQWNTWQPRKPRGQWQHDSAGSWQGWSNYQK